MKKELSWPIFVVSLLLLGVGTNIVMMFIAVDNPSFAIEKNYYKKALHWDKTQLQKQKNRRLGWLLMTSINHSKQGTTFCGRLTAKDHKAIVGAKVSVVAFANARANRRYSWKLKEKQEGLYCTKVSFPRAGLWEFQFLVKTKKHVFTKNLMKAVKLEKRAG